MGRRYLVTGGGGFIGSNFVRHVIATEPASEVVTLDALTYAAVPATVAELRRLPRHTFIEGDIRDADSVRAALRGVDVVVNFAAESHVDRSIASPARFLETNVVGTGVLLDEARGAGVERFVQISTDEVYGSISSGAADEESPLRPSSAYSASKSGADLLVLADAATHGTDVIVTRCTNNYGPYQFPEKLIPLAITRILEGGRIPLYGDGMNERDWLYVEDHCRAIATVIDRGRTGEVYNIGADAQRSNLEVLQALVPLLGATADAIEYVSDRPGHDRRYAVDSTKIRSLGWEPSVTFEDGIVATVEWYLEHGAWWRSALGAV